MICGSLADFVSYLYLILYQNFIRYYAPALGFLMFAVGVNSSPKDFIEAIQRPDAIAAGYVGQFVIKPLLGFLFGTIAVSTFNLPTSLGKKISVFYFSFGWFGGGGGGVRGVCGTV